MCNLFDEAPEIALLGLPNCARHCGTDIHLSRLSSHRQGNGGINIWRKHACAREETDKPAGKSGQTGVRARATGRIGTGAWPPFSALTPAHHRRELSREGRAAVVVAQAESGHAFRSYPLRSGEPKRRGPSRVRPRGGSGAGDLLHPRRHGQGLLYPPPRP